MAAKLVYFVLRKELLNFGEMVPWSTDPSLGGSTVTVTAAFRANPMFKVTFCVCVCV